jgi:single-strand DNA-binding protein
VNLVIASGNLTRDPEMRYTNSGKAVVSFSIAVNEGSGEKRTTVYMDCQAWEKQAELIAEYCRKGRKVLVTGSYSTDSWMDKTTNQKRTRTIITCRNIEFLDRRPDEIGTPPPTEAQPDLSDLNF